MQKKHLLPALLIASLVGLAPLGAQESSGSPPLRWWKGNLHTHSLWSDGDDFPEMIAAWYLEHDYNFLALSDHNVLSDGIRWMKMTDILKRTDMTVLDKYRHRFGDAWVETRGEPGSETFEVRLKPLDEFAPLVEYSGQFIMIPAEEISDRAEGKPVHMNATNLKELIEPARGATVQEAMRNNLRSVLEQEDRTGRQILPHLNHPNFGYAITAQDLANVVQERFFEVYNGHLVVNHLGDKDHISIERMWDVANAIRLTQLDADPLLGIATDDSHNYDGKPGAQPGRGWVMVQTRYLTPEHLILAMKAGQFYASSGVSLSKVHFDAAESSLSVEIEPQGDETYQTDFIAIRKPKKEGDLPAPEDIGRIVASVSGLSARYVAADQDLMVRACITSSLDHPNGSLPGQKQQAWTQPCVVRPAAR